MGIHAEHCTICNGEGCSKCSPEDYDANEGGIQMEEREKFTFFWGGPSAIGQFSQWAFSPFTIGGILYSCAEQWMMAEKARLFGDTETLAKIMATNDPMEQKALGKQVKGFDKATWEAHDEDIVYRGSVAKYQQNPELKRTLLSTVGTTIVEASPEDHLWGIGLRRDDPRAQHRATWEGLNKLGKILTRVRDEFISGVLK